MTFHNDSIVLKCPANNHTQETISAQQKIAENSKNSKLGESMVHYLAYGAR